MALWDILAILSNDFGNSGTRPLFHDSHLPTPREAFAAWHLLEHVSPATRIAMALIPRGVVGNETCLPDYVSSFQTCLPSSSSSGFAPRNSVVDRLRCLGISFTGRTSSWYLPFKRLSLPSSRSLAALRFLRKKLMAPSRPMGSKSGIVGMWIRVPDTCFPFRGQP